MPIAAGFLLLGAGIIAVIVAANATKQAAAGAQGAVNAKSTSAPGSTVAVGPVQGSSTNITWADKAAVLVWVSHKYNIPLRALLGIYGQETSFGTNVTTSSAAAAGDFQFIPSTAAEYHYPYTNTPTLTQFSQQADAWGRLLVANNSSRDPNGWAPAMGGGYSEAQAESTLSGMPAAFAAALRALGASW